MYSRPPRQYLLIGLLAALSVLAQTKGSSIGPAADKVVTAGVITREQGNASVKGGSGSSRSLKRGQVVRPGMLIDTESGSSTVLAFPDGQVGVLGSDGKLRLNDYLYDPSRGRTTVSTSI